MDLDSFILESHCLYSEVSLPSYSQDSSISGSLGQTISSLRKSLLLSITYEDWLFVCSLFLLASSLLQTPYLLFLSFLACLSLCLDGFHKPCLFIVISHMKI